MVRVLYPEIATRTGEAIVFADPAIRIRGLREFQSELRELSGTQAPRRLRVAQNNAAQIVVAWAQSRVPSQSGGARRSIRATSTQRLSQVTGGGRRYPYYPWLDFGGAVGRRKSVRRPYRPGGRYIYPGYAVNRERIVIELRDQLVAAVRGVGWEVQE